MTRIISNNKFINPRKLFLIVIILILLVANIFFWMRYSEIQQELDKTTQALETQKINEKVLNFTKLFITKVLKAESEIDFETRLELENAIRDLDDKEVLEQWQKFTGSETENKAQEEVKNLLEILISKIKE